MSLKLIYFPLFPFILMNAVFSNRVKKRAERVEVVETICEWTEKLRSLGYNSPIVLSAAEQCCLNSG